MIFNHRYFNFCSFILFIAFLSLSSATFCSHLPSTDKETPCFLEPPVHNPSRLRSSGNSLVLPCHVARSKRSSVEWWYQDFQKTINIKIYPVFPAVRPSVLRFITSISPISKNSNETEIIDVSVLLRHVNVDDSGIYRCVIRRWTSDPMINNEDDFDEDNSKLPTLSYHVELTGPRLCQSSVGSLPCFSNMRTSSPTVIDAYYSAFLQCIVHNHNRPANVFWVVGNASENSVLITDYLSKNQHIGDRLRRVFPLSPFDYSIELMVSRDVPERTYSCVIDGATNVETTLFTYHVRNIDLEAIADKSTISHKNATISTDESQTDNTPTSTETIFPHDALNEKEVERLRHKKLREHTKKEDDNWSGEDDLLEFIRREATTSTI